MGDRRFTEIDLRRMLQQATGYREDVVEGRWVIETRHRGKAWEVIVEPDRERRLVGEGTPRPGRGGGRRRKAPSPAPFLPGGPPPRVRPPARGRGGPSA